jgi:hypothetical protein
MAVVYGGEIIAQPRTERKIGRIGHLGPILSETPAHLRRVTDLRLLRKAVYPSRVGLPIGSQ